MRSRAGLVRGRRVVGRLCLLVVAALVWAFLAGCCPAGSASPVAHAGFADDVHRSQGCEPHGHDDHQPALAAPSTVVPVVDQAVVGDVAVAPPGFVGSTPARGARVAVEPRGRDLLISLCVARN